MRRLPPVALAIRRQHPRHARPRRPHPAEREVGDGDGVDVVELAVVDVVGRQLRVVERQEPHEQRVVRLAQGGDVAEPAERLGDGPDGGAGGAGGRGPVGVELAVHVTDLPSRRRCRFGGRA